MAALIADSCRDEDGHAGNGKIATLPAGTYYLFGFAIDNRQPMMWDVRVDLKPGPNAITLDRRNATLLN
jgi:hypothetical protein